MKAGDRVSNAESKRNMQGLHVTHFLDMVAGGNPRTFSRDPDGNPVLGAGDVNSHLRNQWARDGRADFLCEEAKRMREAGRHGEKMNVELERCKLTS